MSPFPFSPFPFPVVNEVQFEYNNFGQLITDYQAHGGQVDPLATRKVEYAYATGAMFAVPGGAFYEPTQDDACTWFPCTCPPPQPPVIIFLPHGS